MYKVFLQECPHDYSSSPQPLDTFDLFATHRYRYYGTCMCMLAFASPLQKKFNMETHYMYICQICKYENICNIYTEFEPIKFSWQPTNRANYYGQRYVYLGYIHSGALSTLVNKKQCVLIT